MSSIQKSNKRIQQHIAALGHSDPKVAQRAEELLIRYYGSRAVEQLIRASDNPKPEFRFRLAWVLGYSRDPDAFETVLALTQDTDGFVRYDAAIALGILGDERGIAPLIALATTPDPENCVHDAAANGLTRLGKPAIPALLELLESENIEARNLAIWALCRIGNHTGDDALLEKLAALLDTDESTRLYLLDTFLFTDAPNLIPFVEPYLADASEKVRDAAATCLQSLRNPR